jgi:hypothetical protein
VGEVALVLVLLIAAGLLLRSFSNLMRLDPGYDPRNVLTAKMRYVFPESGTYPRMVAFFSDVLSKAQAIPSVRYAAVSQVLPLEDYRVATTVWFGTTGPPPTGSLKITCSADQRFARLFPRHGHHHGCRPRVYGR